MDQVNESIILITSHLTIMVQKMQLMEIHCHGLCETAAEVADYLKKMVECWTNKG